MSTLLNLPKLGETFNVLFKDRNNKFFKFSILNEKDSQDEEKWKEIQILPVEVRKTISSAYARRISGIDEKSSDFTGIIAGLGALGSSVADIWAKESWGKWILVDDDYIAPHNIVRHIAKDMDIGTQKVATVKAIMELNYFPGYKEYKAINDKINNFENPEINASIKNAELFIDATTTIGVTRDFSNLDYAPRSASIFITPNGKASVLFLEDQNRAKRLSSLEAQYYRAIINNPWGEEFLISKNKGLRVGAGCSDISFVISQELISLYAATLARQIRLNSVKIDALIQIWELQDNTGELIVLKILPENSKVVSCNNWKIYFDDGIVKKISSIRKQELPNETGGIILGYIDQILFSIYVVDVLDAPLDSISKPTSFIRGTKDLKENLEEIRRRTAFAVDYIGEWHSHPRNCSTFPSFLDKELIEYLAYNLESDGIPALMMIAGDIDLNFIVKEV